MDETCLTEDVVLALIDGTLSDEEAASAHEHIGHCSECRAVVATASGTTLAESAHLGMARTVNEAVASEPPTSLARGASVGRYVILDLVGAGNMGVVYAAYDPELDRKVALKLLHTVAPWAVPAEEDLRKRLLREARAMARVSHPNVVSVYDAGIVGDRVFVAMEFVEGTTLRRWAREKPRAWREILSVFVAAGRGLAAAHAAGLVHRDFKPDNVLIGRDGRVCVGDFGLARAEAQESSSFGAELMHSASSGEGPVTELTRTGALIGTPAYMAPEQLRGEKADARADQFSFAVALYEVLSGSRPYAGDSVEEMSQAMRDGALPARTAAWSAPARVQRLLARALKIHPRDRYPSMGALLAALERRPALWRGAALIFAAAAVSLGVFAYARHDTRTSCAGGEEKLAGVWDAQRQEAIRSAFAATGKPYATDVWNGVQRTLDAYAQRWVAMHRDACEATHRREEQSEHLRDLRMQCLGERLARMKALADVLARADDKVLSNAVQAAYALVDVTGCADARALTTGVPAPEESIRPKVEALSERLSQANARLDAGKYADGLRIAAAVLEEAQPLGYRPLEAEAYWLKGELLHRTGDLPAAEATLLEAVRAADAARRDDLGAKGRIGLVKVVGIDRSKHAEGHLWARFADAAIERLGGDVRLRAQLQARVGLLFREEGRLAEAVSRVESAVSLTEQALGTEHPEFAAALNTLGTLFQDTGRFDEATRCYERTLTIQRKVLGPGHPAVAHPLNNLGVVFLVTAQSTKALSYFRQALAVWEKALGPKHPYAATAHGNIAIAMRHLGRFREAIAEDKLALALREELLGREHPHIAASLQSLGNDYFQQGRYDTAGRYYERALAMLERLLGPENSNIANTLLSIGNLLLRRQQFAKARAVAERAQSLIEKSRGLRHPSLGEALTVIGRAYVGLGAPAAAIHPLERALSLRDTTQSFSLDLAETKFALARALWDSRRDPARSLHLAREAAKELAKSLDANARDRAEVNAWLRQRARGR
jgi:tetratricopeptide (TPR) repeat protein